jgi:hypothetical protein
MVEKEKDLIGFAHKVISFRMNVIKACKSKGIDVPTDEQISDYINDYGLHFEDFMADYIEHEGMFRCLKTPLEEFKDEVNSINWGNTPSDEEIISFFNAYGNNISLFVRQQNIKDMGSLERKVFLKTIGTLPTEKLVILWNTFIEESALYGEDSYIYDLENVDECKFLGVHMKSGEFNEILMLAANGTRFVQWFAHNNGNIAHLTEEDIKNTLSTFWTEIFERIMVYPSAYNFKIGLCEGDGSTYFDDIFFPIIAEQVGYIIDVNKGTIKKVEK